MIRQPEINQDHFEDLWTQKQSISGDLGPEIAPFWWFMYAENKPVPNQEIF